MTRAFEAALPARVDRPRDPTHAVGARVRAPTIPWSGAIGLLVLVIWLIPIKSYKLPVTLPFNLEIYRLLIILLLTIWAVSVLSGSASARVGGAAKTLAILAVGAFASLLINLGSISASGLQTQAVKSLSFFLTYLIAFLLISSTLERVSDAINVLRAVVIGAVIVAFAAVYESRTQHNLFNNLQSVLPFLVHSGRNSQILKNLSGGQLRVRASAQHPIALGCALAMSVPLAIHLAERAVTRWGRRAWLAAGGVVCMGALATVSRTAILMFLAMGVCALWLRGRELLRYWPLLIVLAGVAHFAAPGAISHIYKRFNPQGGVVAQLNSRPGLRGSGRFADLGPGLSYWSKAPLFGHGLGTVAATGDSLAASAAGSPVEGPPIIFDDQYMNTLVSLGIVGFAGIIVFVWGTVLRIGRTARSVRSKDGNLLAVCAIAGAGFGASMATFDAFTFVQSTLLFFTIAAIGLRVRTLLTE